MKRYRSALMAGLLALAVAVCDDEGTVVQPPPVVNVAPPVVNVAPPVVNVEPAPPTVAPLAAMITPPSAEVGVDGMVDFAVGTTGGSGDASWTCTSSDTAVATVETTDTGCRATAVAGGGATITAAVTKGSESTNVAANLTVSTTADGSILVTNISSEGTGDDDVKGTVDVTIQVERGNQTFEKLSLNVDGMEVASQGFGTAAAAEDAEQNALTFTLSFDSDGYEEHGDHVDVDYMNGEHSIQALLKIAGRDDALMSNVMLVEFDNDDKLKASMSGLGEGAANESTGQMWYGGPAASVEITALPIVYSSGGVSSVTLREFCGDEAMTDSEAPFMFEVDCKGYTSDKDGDGDKPEFNVGGDKIGVSVSAVYLDFEGPAAPHFNADPNGREDGWINQAVLVATTAGEFHATKNKDGWLVYNEDEEGVGGYAPQVRFSSTTPSIVDGACEATPNAPPTGPTKENAVCVIATAVDLLGNESGLPSAGSDCVTAANYVGMDDEGNTTYAAGIRAGLDVGAPTIQFSPASPKENASSLREFQVQVADAGSSTGPGHSGLHSMPVLSKVEARDADNDVLCGHNDDLVDDDALMKVDGGGKESLAGECQLDGGADFNDPLATTEGLGSGSETGYYTFTALAQDKAGNKSEMVMRTAVSDGDDPELGLIVGGYSSGSWSLTTTLTDDLSLKAYWPEAVQVIAGVGPTTGGITILPREGGVMVDEYNSPTLTQSHLTTFTMQVFRALQPDNTGPTADATLAATATLDSIQVVGTDHGGRNGAAGTVSLGDADRLARYGLGTARTLTITDGSGTDGAPTTAAERTTQETEAERWNDNEIADGTATTRYKRDEVFQTFTVEDDEDDDDALELRATITGAKSYEAAAAGVVGVDATETAPAVEAEAPTDGVEGLVNSPVSRVDFYAAVLLDDATVGNKVPPVPDGPGATPDANEALVFLGSSSAAGAEDFMHDNGTDTDDTDDYAARRYVWGLDMSGADFVEKAGGEGNYTIVAIAVNSAGVAIVSTTTEMVEK